MQAITLKHLKELIQLPAKPTVSIYMPIYKKGADQQQNPIRLHNLIKKAREQLKESNVATHNLKEQVTQVEKDSQTEDFWEHLGTGAVIFIYEDSYTIFRLPINTPERVYVADHHYFKPLLPLYTTNGNFFILSLSQNDIKLYEANRTAIDKHFLGEIPRNIKDYLDYEDLDSHIQTHSTSGSGDSGVHGQGPGDESIKADISKFLNQVENGITQILADETAPLVLAGVEYLTTMYAGHNKYHNLVDQTIDGHPAKTTKEKLHQSAWEIVKPVFKQKEKTALEKYHELAGTGKTSTELEEIIKASLEGKIETLFITRDLVQWGFYVPKTNTLSLYEEQKPNSRDLYDYATTQTLNNSGTVYSLKPEEMIENSQIAAIFRY